jgi:hypothetical protein
VAGAAADLEAADLAVVVVVLAEVLGAAAVLAVVAREEVGRATGVLSASISTPKQSVW